MVTVSFLLLGRSWLCVDVCYAVCRCVLAYTAVSKLELIKECSYNCSPTGGDITLSSHGLLGRVYLVVCTLVI